MIHTKTSSTTIPSGSTDAPFTDYTMKSTLINSTQIITDVTPNTSTKRTSTFSYDLSSTGKRSLTCLKHHIWLLKNHWEYQNVIDDQFICTRLLAGTDASETEAMPTISTVSSMQCIDEQPWCGHAHCSKKIVQMYCKRKCNLCPICKSC